MSTTNELPTPETITLISQSDLMDVIIQLFRERDEAKAYAERCRDGCISLSHSIDRIDYACGEPNEMGVSEYCVHQNDEAVVARVKGMRETLRNAEAELSVATAERDDSRRKMIDLEEHVAKLKLERSELWVEIAAAKHGDSGYAVLQERHEKQLEASPRQTPNIPQAMTTAQLDHLRAIEAHLDRLLAIAAKRTPGEWDASGSKNEVIGNNEYGFLAKEEVCCSPKRNQFWPENATFIALCANNAEAGWRSAKAAIEALKFLSVRTCDESCPGELPHASDVFIDSILAEWPLETLKP